MKFEVYPDGSGKYRWRLWPGSNKVAASGESFASKFNAGGESFVSKANAERAAENVRDSAGGATGP